jgi:hypothetical protein
MNPIPQSTLADLILPLLATQGHTYYKYRPVFAKKALGGEYIETHTADGLETVNTANEGDYIIKNQTEAGEMYAISAVKFAQKYEWQQHGPDGFDEYKPLGQIVALEMTDELLKNLGLPDDFHFIATWGELMRVRAGDFLASPTELNEVYRIARAEFFETYALR